MPYAIGDLVDDNVVIYRVITIDCLDTRNPRRPTVGRSAYVRVWRPKNWIFGPTRKFENGLSFFIFEGEPSEADIKRMTQIKPNDLHCVHRFSAAQLKGKRFGKSGQIKLLHEPTGNNPGHVVAYGFPCTVKRNKAAYQSADVFLEKLAPTDIFPEET